MQHGWVFLAGNAAHLITPAGGKGMNMAIQDAVELAGGLAEQYGQDRDGLSKQRPRRLGHGQRCAAATAWRLRGRCRSRAARWSRPG
jgi:p-hydroxybenzoate 3-monooxygenase